MKKYYKTGKFLFISILGLLLFLIDAQAQIIQRPIGWPWNGAEYLATRAVDTTNISRIRQIADSCGHSLNSTACLFLAQHGYKDIIPKIIECYYHSYDHSDLNDAHILTIALATLDTTLAHPYALSLFDTMYVHKREMKWNYSSNDFIDVIMVLLDLKDYSKYDVFKSYFIGNDKPNGYFIEEFLRFAENSVLEQDAYETVKTLLSSTDENYRYHAQRTLLLFDHFPDRILLLKQIALNDLSGRIRHEISGRLERMGYISDAIQCYESLIRSKIDTFYCDLAVYDLADINSPYALAALLRLKGELEPGGLLTHVESKINADNVRFSLLYQSMAIRDYIDTLGAFVNQCASLGWLGDQSFVSQLGQYITDAKIPLTIGDSVNCARKIKLFQQSIDKEYNDTLNATSNFIAFEGWKFLHYNAQYILDRLPQIPPSGCNVKLVSSTSAKLTGGALQYYEGSWKDAVNNNDGTFSINTQLKTLSLRMTYEYGSQTKSNVSISSDTIVFQTINAQIKLQNSTGAFIDTGSVQYYAGAWRNFGTTTNGIVAKDLLPNTYSFRLTYAYASKDKQQDIGTNATVVFQTVNTAVQLKNSQGVLIDQGTVQYYSGAWRDMGTTTNGIVTKDLLPNTYSFRMSHEYVSVDKAQDISTNSTVSFSTVLCIVRASTLTGQPVNGATASYYSGAWRQIGNTINGEITKELLPASLTFRVSYNNKQQDKAQNLSTNNVVQFAVQ